MDFTFSLENLETNIKLDERETMIFRSVAEIGSVITLDKNVLKSGGYQVDLKKRD